MPRYVVERTFDVDVDEDGTPEVGRRSTQIGEEQFPEDLAPLDGSQIRGGAARPGIVQGDGG